jgi:anti-sigma factor RsiW
MVAIDCTLLDDRLGDYVDRVLSPDERVALESHLATCVVCQERLHDYLAIPELVRRATDVAMSPDAQARLQRLIALNRRRPS